MEITMKIYLCIFSLGYKVVYLFQYGVGELVYKMYSV